VSTAMDLGERDRAEGVWAPGVAGGVNEGEMRLLGRPGVAGWDGWRSCQPLWSWSWKREARGMGARRGEALGGRSEGNVMLAVWVVGYGVLILLG
jgi:hypothetical protein